MTEPAEPNPDARHLTADFYERVVDQIPTPIMVVDQVGGIVYGNRFMSHTVGLSLEEARGRNIIEFIHDDDVSWAIDAFRALSEAGRDDSPWASEPWAPVPMRVVDGSGHPLHVEVTGANSLHDDVVDGFIYEVRHGAEPRMLRDVLTGLASGRPVGELVQLVAQMIAAPPIRIEVVIAEVGSGRCRIVGATGERLAAALDGHTPPTAVLFVDLDGFKPVNDEHGHAAGDHVLRAAAQRVQRAVRPGDVVARVGGDEFVVVLPAVDASQDLDATVESIADRIVRELTRPIQVNGVEIRISASIGIAVAPRGGDVDALVAAADAAMYEAKRAGGAGYRIRVVSPAP